MSVLLKPQATDRIRLLPGSIAQRQLSGVILRGEQLPLLLRSTAQLCRGTKPPGAKPSPSVI